MSALPGLPRLVLQNSSDGVIVQDASGRFIYANDAAALALGYPSAEALVESTLAEVGARCEIWDEDGDPVPLSRLLGPQALEGATEPEVTLRFHAVATGEEHWSVVRAVPMLDEEGRVRLGISYFRDITERKRAEEELCASRDQLEAILTGVADGIAVLDASGRMIYANAAAAKLVGMPSVQALLEAPVEEIRQRYEVTDEDGQPLSLEQLPSRLTLRGMRAPERVVRSRTVCSDEERWTMVRATPVFDQHGNVQFVINIFQDITERRRAEELRQRAIAQERDRIARDLHDNLAQVLFFVNSQAGAVQRLLEGGRTEEAARQLGQLAEAARGLSSDVRESILWLRATPVGWEGLSTSLKRYLSLWQERSAVVVDLELPSAGSPERGLSEDEELQLLRIIQEALANVRKHALATRVLVRLSEEDGWVEVVVEDDGVGFAAVASEPRQHPRFGLAIMRERAEAIGGTLTIDAAAGGGTRVTVRVPAHGIATGLGG
ncbi:MAG: PAS domain-containing protein [Chloroflexota bacterium]|nr:PAS domain-containing protein [Chloroflexota bacterium]